MDINSTIKLYDNYTPVLRAIIKTSSDVIRMMEHMNRSSNSAINPEAIKKAKNELSQVSVQLDMMTQKQAGVNNVAQKSAGLFANIKQQLGGVLIAYAGINGIKFVSGLSDALTNVNAKLKMVNDGTMTMAELQDKIKSSALDARTAYLDQADAVARLGMLAKDALMLY